MENNSSNTVVSLFKPYDNDIDKLIAGIMEAYHLRALRDFATWLNVDPSTVSKWRIRNSLFTAKRKIEIAAKLTLSEIKGMKNLAKKLEYVPLNEVDSLLYEMLVHFGLPSYRSLAKRISLDYTSMLTIKANNNISPLYRIVYLEKLPVGDMKRLSDPTNVEGVSEVIERLKVFLGIKTNHLLAKKLKIAYSTLYRNKNLNAMTPIQTRIREEGFIEDGFIPLMEKGEYFLFPARK